MESPHNVSKRTCVCVQAQRLLLQDGSLAHFTVQNPSCLPTITLGLPANAKVFSYFLFSYININSNYPDKQDSIILSL